jgi:hypothetical protein
VRATEKDRVKIGDCFRGGDVVRGVVVCNRFDQRALLYLTNYRSRWVMHAATLLQLPEMISGSSLRRAKQVGGFKWGEMGGIEGQYRRNDGTCVMAGDAMPKDRSSRETQMCETG